MTRDRLLVITALVLAGCQAREVVKLALDFDPPPQGCSSSPVTARGRAAGRDRSRDRRRLGAVGPLFIDGGASSRTSNTSP